MNIHFNITNDIDGKEILYSTKNILGIVKYFIGYDLYIPVWLRAPHKSILISAHYKDNWPRTYFCFKYVNNKATKLTLQEFATLLGYSRYQTN